MEDVKLKINGLNVMTVAQAAKTLNVSTTTIYQWIKNGTQLKGIEGHIVKGIEVNNTWYVYEHTIEEYLEVTK